MLFVNRSAVTTDEAQVHRTTTVRLCYYYAMLALVNAALTLAAKSALFLASGCKSDERRS